MTLKMGAGLEILLQLGYHKPQSFDFDTICMPNHRVLAIALSLSESFGQNEGTRNLVSVVFLLRLSIYILQLILLFI